MKTVIELVKEENARHSAIITSYKENRETISAIRHALEEVSNINVTKFQLDDINPNELSITFAGDFSTFKNVWAILRKQGFEPSSHAPHEKFSSYCDWWKKEGTELQIWFNYSSTVCKMKVIGKEMVEVSKYELVCE